MNLLLLDFEATCDEPVNPVPQEVIEFPVVWLSGPPDSLVVQGDFHEYVRPMRYQQWSNFLQRVDRNQSIEVAGAMTGERDGISDFEQNREPLPELNEKAGPSWRGNSTSTKRALVHFKGCGEPGSRLGMVASVVNQGN